MQGICSYWLCALWVIVYNGRNVKYMKINSWNTFSLHQSCGVWVICDYNIAHYYQYLNDTRSPNSPCSASSMENVRFLMLTPKSCLGEFFPLVRSDSLQFSQVWQLWDDIFTNGKTHWGIVTVKPEVHLSITDLWWVPHCRCWLLATHCVVTSYSQPCACAIRHIYLLTLAKRWFQKIIFNITMDRRELLITIVYSKEAVGVVEEVGRLFCVS